MICTFLALAILCSTGAMAAAATPEVPDSVLLPYNLVGTTTVEVQETKAKRTAWILK